MKITKKEAETYGVPLINLKKGGEIPEMCYSYSTIRDILEYKMTAEERKKPDGFYWKEGMTGYTAFYNINRFPNALRKWKVFRLESIFDPGRKV